MKRFHLIFGFAIVFVLLLTGQYLLGIFALAFGTSFHFISGARRRDARGPNTE